MTRLLCLTTLLTAATQLGCAGGGQSPVVPLAATIPGAPEEAGSLLPPGQYLTSQWTLTVAGNATGELRETPERVVAAANQGRYYDLDISKFVSAQDLRVTGFNFDINGDVLVDFMHAHPFWAPDFSQPITAGNRADLSYTGKLLILADQQNTEIAEYGFSFDPGVVRSPDGYAATGDLLRNTGFTNNLFPYKLLVDEALDNRIGVSNEGIAAGNYDVANAGWNRDNAGDDGDGWTGFDTIHAGQRVMTQIAIPRERLDAGEVEFGLAILIKYTDPRGTPNETGRFPAEPPDAVEFSYRMPHAAWDVGRCASCAELSIQNVDGATADFEVTVRDWDVSGVTNGDDTLWDEEMPNTILPGSEARPTVLVDVPGVIAEPVTATTTGGTGAPPTEWTFKGTLTMKPGGTTPGDYWGIVAAIDPESSTAGYAGLHFGVDAETLAADAARALPLISYSVFPLNVPPWEGWGVNAGAPSGTPDGLAVGSDGTTVVAYNTRSSWDADPGTCLDWREPHGTGFKDDLVLAWIDIHGNIERVQLMGGSETERQHDIAMDDENSVYLVGEYQSDDFDFNPGFGETIIPAEGDRLGYLAKYTMDGGFSWVQVWGQGTGTLNGAPGWDVALGPAGEIALVGDYFGTAVDIDPGPGTQPLPDGTGEAYLTVFNATGEWQWAHSWQASGLTFLRAVYITESGDILVGGLMEGNVDLDPGPGTDPYPAGGFGDACLVRLNSSGEFEWGHGWGGEDEADIIWHIGEQAASNRILASGMFRQTPDFDPGPGTVERTSQGAADSYISQFEEDGTFVAVAVWGGPENENGWGGLTAPDGSIYLSGDFRGTVDFDAGPGTHELTSASLHDPYLLHLNPDLSLDWVVAVGDLGSGQGIKVGLDVGRNEPLLLFRNGGLADVHPGPEEVILDGSTIGLTRYAPDGSW